MIHGGGPRDFDGQRIDPDVFNHRHADDCTCELCVPPVEQRAAWFFSLHWSNDEPLYRAVLDYATTLLRRVPSMTDQTLGRNVRDAVQRWCVDERADALGWQERSYVIDPRVLRMMREEVEGAGGFAAVGEVGIGEDVREALAIEQ